MPEYVSKDVINQRVVREWCRLMTNTAKDRGDNLSAVQPFPPFQQTYSEVMAEVRAGSGEGIRFYQYMVRQSVGYDFKK